MWAPKSSDGDGEAITREVPTGPTWQQLARNSAATLAAKLDGQGIGVAAAALGDSFSRGLWAQRLFVDAFVAKGGVSLMCGLASAASDDDLFYMYRQFPLHRCSSLTPRRCFQALEQFCCCGHVASFCDSGGICLIGRALAAYRGGATLLRHCALRCAALSAADRQIVKNHWPNSDLVALLIEHSMQDQTWPVTHCEEASSALLAATETDDCVVESVVHRELCSNLVSIAFFMVQHSGNIAVHLLRICCKCVQFYSAQTVQQLRDSKTVQRLTVLAKGPVNHVVSNPETTSDFGSLRIYSSMLLASLASGSDECILEPLLTHGSLRFICASIGDHSFLDWETSKRIGSSYALLALCREPRTWLQLQDAQVELSLSNVLLDPCHEVRMNGIHMAIAVAQIGSSQMRHIVKHLHGTLCQIFFNCITVAVPHLQDIVFGSQEFTELTAVVDALFYLAKQHEAIIQQINLRVTTLLLNIISETGGEIARRVSINAMDGKVFRIRRLRHQVAELLCIHALHSKDSDVKLLWLGRGLDVCYEMLFDAMSHIDIKTRVDWIRVTSTNYFPEVVKTTESIPSIFNRVSVSGEPQVFFSEVLNLCATLNRLFMFSDVQSEMLKAPSQQLQVFLSVLRNPDIPQSASLSIGRILVRLSVLPSFCDLLPNEDGFNRTIVQTLITLRRLGDSSLNDTVGAYLLIIGNLTLHSRNRKKFLDEGALEAVADWVGVCSCDSKVAHAASHALQSLVTGCDNQRRLKLHLSNDSVMSSLCNSIRDIWKQGLSRDILAVHCGCVAVLCSGNDSASKAFRDVASRSQIISILYMLHKGLQSETATLLKRPDAKHNEDIRHKLKRNQSTLACVLSATSGFSFNMDEGSGIQLAEAKLCNELVKEVFDPLCPDENVQNASLQILGRMFSSNIVVQALFADIKENLVIDVVSACCKLIIDVTANSESVIGSCIILERLTSHDQGTQRLIEVFNSENILLSLLSFTNPVHCLKRLRPQLLSSPDAQLSKLSSVFVVATNLCKVFCRVIAAVAASSQLHSSFSKITETIIQPRESCLSFSCYLVSDILIACCRRDGSSQISALEHWAPKASDLPSSSDDMVLKLTLAMSVSISISWVHSFVQLVITMFDCAALQSKIVPPITTSTTSAVSIEASLLILSGKNESPNEPFSYVYPGSNDENFGMYAWGLSEAVFSMCVSLLCSDLTSCEGAKVLHIMSSFLQHEQVHRWILSHPLNDSSRCKGELLLSRLCSMAQIRVKSLRLDPVSVSAFYPYNSGNSRYGAGFVVQTIIDGISSVADSCVTWMMPDLILRTGLLNTLMEVAELACAMLLHEKVAELHNSSITRLLCSAVRGLCGCLFESSFALKIQSSRTHGAIFMVFARMMERSAVAKEKFPLLPMIRVDRGQVQIDSENGFFLESCLGFAVADVVSGETPSRYFFETLLHGSTEQAKIEVIDQLESEEDNLNSRHRAAASVRPDGIQLSTHCASVLIMFINCLWSRELFATCTAGPVILRALSMAQHNALPAEVKGAAMKALCLALKPCAPAISFLVTKVLNIIPTLFANGFNFPPPASCIAEPALQALCYLSLDPSCRSQLLNVDVLLALSQWIKVAPKSQDLSRNSKDSLSVIQKVEMDFYSPIFLNFYDPSATSRCRALAISSLVCMFSSSCDSSIADTIISTPLIDTLIRSAASTITPIILDDVVNKLPFECTNKISQLLSLCCISVLSHYESIALYCSQSVEFKKLMLLRLSEGQPECKPYVISLLFLVNRSCPLFMQSLFDDASRVGPQAIGSLVRSLLDYLADYSQSLRIELEDEVNPNAAQRDAEHDEFDSELVSQQNLYEWRRFFCLIRQKGITKIHHCYIINSDVLHNEAESGHKRGPFAHVSAGVRRFAVSSKTSGYADADHANGNDYCSGLRWIGIEASELLLLNQFSVSPRMHRFLSSTLASVPCFRAYTEAMGRPDVFAISLQLPLSALQKLLPVRHTLSLSKQTTVLQIPNHLLLPQLLSVLVTSLCSSERLTQYLLHHHNVEKILSIILAKILELWCHCSSSIVHNSRKFFPIDHNIPRDVLLSPSICFRIDSTSSLSCVLALESYSQLIQRIGVCSRLFFSCDLQLIGALLACATCGCMPNDIESSELLPTCRRTNFQPRHASFLSLRLTSPLEVVTQCFSCLRAAAKFTPAISVLLHSPYCNINFSENEATQNRLARMIHSTRDSCNLNQHAVWKSSCSVLAQDFDQVKFSPFKLAVCWLSLIFCCNSRSNVYFKCHNGSIRSTAQLAEEYFEPDIFHALRSDEASVQSIASNCFEIFALVSSTSEGRDCIYCDESSITSTIAICRQYPEDDSLRVFLLTAFHNFSCQSSSQSLELLLRDHVLEFLKDCLALKNVEGLQLSLQIVANLAQRSALIGKASASCSQIFKQFWGLFQSSLCSCIVAAALHPVPVVMRSALTAILNSCAPGNPPKIRRLLASSGVFNIMQQILLHPQRNLKLLALGTLASVVDGDTVESLRWSNACATIIDAISSFHDKGQDAIDTHIRLMTIACIHNVSIEPLCWDNGLDDMKVQSLLSSAGETLTLDARKVLCFILIAFRLSSKF